MSIDFWGLGLQAINVLILVWLLSRLFWRPVATAIVVRQDLARSLMDDATAAKATVDAALAEIEATRASFAMERKTLLSKAADEAEAATEEALADARDAADKLTAATRRAAERDAATARDQAIDDGAALAVDIARKLLARLDTPEARTAFLGLLVGSIEAMTPQDRAALSATAGGIELVGPGDLQDADQAKTADAVRRALGGRPTLTFTSDPGLIAGLELRTDHFALHNSWRADLDVILKDLKHAG